MNKKEFYSNNCIKITSTSYMNKYKIIVIKNSNNIKDSRLYEYDKIKDDYKIIYSSFNEYSFIEYLKSNKIKKYFSFNELELINF